VLGYFLETTPIHATKLQEDPRFIHRQTMANAMRFTTVELGELEGRIARAADQALALEQNLFADLVGEVTGRADSIADTAGALALLDTAAALATLAVEARYCRPQVDDSLTFRIEGGRHPVVEAALARTQGRFVSNDCDLSPEGAPNDDASDGTPNDDASGDHLWLVTGPNMAGKSTFLRQNALIAILAQIGSFVPAESAHIGVVDQLFSRVGAADDLARGRSTFMVEMVETAAILNQAGARALVILDEIGRGTATFDGLSIAWAAVEQLHAVNRSRALFATHYHELTLLAGTLDGLGLHTMRVKEWRGDVVFLHEVTRGAADRSYGIHVARLAGLPPAVIARAEAVLTRLQASEQGSAVARLADDLPLFAAAEASAPATPEISALEQALDTLQPDELTPRAALDALYALKKLRRDED
jgi:DNA mismatch repair protein MutS